MVPLHHYPQSQERSHCIKAYFRMDGNGLWCLKLSILLQRGNSIMSDLSGKLETRGRPRKQQHQQLPSLSRQLFSQHCAVLYACCMVYVLEVFLRTKHQKRIGHSEGGFTIYQKIKEEYCFEEWEQAVREWGWQEVLASHPRLAQFTRTLNGCAPKFVFRELVRLIIDIHLYVLRKDIQRPQELESSLSQALSMSEEELDVSFKYIRFTAGALRELKMEKWAGEVKEKVKELWGPFLKVVAFTTFCVSRGVESNKYLKPFFSDAERPQETIIGQLNLRQIVESREKKESVGFTRIKEEDMEGKRRVEADRGGSKGGQSVLRPVTLITFPSGHSIDSPFKPVKESPLKQQLQGTEQRPTPPLLPLQMVEGSAGRKRVKEEGEGASPQE